MNDILEKKDLRFSDSDFVTYLILQGYNYTDIEITYDKKHNKLKAFTHFQEDKEVLIKLHNDYNDGKLLVNPKDFTFIRKKLNNEIKIKLNKYRKK